MNEYTENSYTVEGYTFRFQWYYDDTPFTPWEDEDGHGPVSEWTTRDKAPGERVLCTDGRHKRFYDFAEAVKIAKRNGWDAPPYGEGTPGQRAVRAVEADFKWLKDWCNDQWFYVGYVMTVTDPEGDEIPEESDSLWGIDSPSMDCFEKDAMAGVVERIKDRANQKAADSITETVRAFDAACRDIVTV